MFLFSFQKILPKRATCDKRLGWMTVEPYLKYNIKTKYGFWGFISDENLYCALLSRRVILYVNRSISEEFTAFVIRVEMESGGSVVQLPTCSDLKLGEEQFSWYVYITRLPAGRPGSIPNRDQLWDWPSLLPVKGTLSLIWSRIEMEDGGCTFQLPSYAV
jgi:hypothetical protein